MFGIHSKSRNPIVGPVSIYCQLPIVHKWKKIQMYSLENACALFISELVDFGHPKIGVGHFYWVCLNLLVSRGGGTARKNPKHALTKNCHTAQTSHCHMCAVFGKVALFVCGVFCCDVYTQEVFLPRAMFKWGLILCVCKTGHQINTHSVLQVQVTVTSRCGHFKKS